MLVRRGHCQHINGALQEPTADSDLIRVVSRQYAPYMQAAAWDNDTEIAELKLQTCSLGLGYICTYTTGPSEQVRNGCWTGCFTHVVQWLSYTIYLHMDRNPGLGISDSMLRYPGQAKQLTTRRLFTKFSN